MRVSIIAAMSSNRVIGRDNALPWRLKADLRRFKKLTMGHTLVMGRRTFESIGRALPGRSTVVVTRREDFTAPDVRVTHTLEEALGLAVSEELFVAGGADIYRQTLGRADRLYLTLIDLQCEGDAFFPELDTSGWRLVSEEIHDADEGQPAYRFVVYDRMKEGKPR
jgi:dihydrofolate reductase